MPAYTISPHHHPRGPKPYYPPMRPDRLTHPELIDLLQAETEPLDYSLDLAPDPLGQTCAACGLVIGMVPAVRQPGGPWMHAACFRRAA